MLVRRPVFVCSRRARIFAGSGHGADILCGPCVVGPTGFSDDELRCVSCAWWIASCGVWCVSALGKSVKRGIAVGFSFGERPTVASAGRSKTAAEFEISSIRVFKNRKSYVIFANLRGDRSEARASACRMYRSMGGMRRPFATTGTPAVDDSLSSRLPNRIEAGCSLFCRPFLRAAL